MGGATTAASGSGGDDTGQMLLENLVPALAQTFALVLLGVLTARFSLLPPHAGETLGAYTAKFALPALIFTAMSTLNLGDASMGLLAGMCGAKLALGVLVALISLALSRGGSRERGWSMAAIFAMLTTMQNDFALGLPILNALYRAFAIKRFWTPFSRPFCDRFGPFFGVLVPVSGILGARRRRRRKNGEKTT